VLRRVAEHAVAEVAGDRGVDDIAELADVAGDAQLDPVLAQTGGQLGEHLCRGDVDERTGLRVEDDEAGLRCAQPFDLLSDVVAVGEEEPGLARMTTLCWSGWSPSWRSTSSHAFPDLTSLATCGRDTRYSSGSIDAAMPMNSPGRVSKTSTPSIAAIAAEKSARAAKL
jgi:hypothetical protein